MSGLSKPESNHPLTAHRRAGVVADIANAPATVNVYVGGDTTTLVPCPYLTPNLPSVNNHVVLLESNGDYVIVGVVAATAWGQPILDANTPLTCVAGGPIPYASVPTDLPGGWDGGTSKYTVPAGCTGLWDVRAQFKQTGSVASAGNLYVNGNRRAATPNFPTSNTFTGGSLNFITNFAAGDTVWTQASVTFTPQNDSGSVGSNFLQLRYLAPTPV